MWSLFAALTLPTSAIVSIIVFSAIAGSLISAVIFNILFRHKLETYDQQQEIIEYLQGQVILLNNKVAQLESSSTVDKKRNHTIPDYYLLAVVGNDAATRDDLNALRQSGVDVVLSYPPTLESFERRLNNLRATDRLPRGIHFGLHAGSNGIEFEDKPATIEWLSENLSGIEVILIAGCKGSEIGYQLATRRQRVITVQHEIDSEHAALLTRVFWEQIASGKNVLSAFSEAKRRLPLGITELMELH